MPKLSIEFKDNIKKLNVIDLHSLVINYAKKIRAFMII